MYIHMLVCYSCRCQTSLHHSIDPHRLFGDDARCHNGLSMRVLDFTHVVPEVDGLHVLHGHDALRDPRGVGHASLNQPPGGLDVDRTLVAHD